MPHKKRICFVIFALLALSIFVPLIKLPVAHAQTNTGNLGSFVMPEYGSIVDMNAYYSSGSVNAFTLTIEDASNNVLWGFTYNFGTWTSFGGSIQIPISSGSPSSLSLVSGVTYQLIATAVYYPGGTSTSASSASIDYNPIYSFSFSAVSSPQSSGVAFSVTISASNSYSGTQTLTCNSGSVTVSPSSITLSGGSWSGSVTLTSSSSVSGLYLILGDGDSNSFTLNVPSINNFYFNSISSPQTSGVPFAVTITAQAAGGATLTSYNSAPTLLCSAASSTVTPSSVTFVNGVWTGTVTVVVPATTTGAYLYVSGYSGNDNSASFTLNVVASGLVGYWNLDEGTGTTAYDNSGNSNTGTLSGSPSWVQGKYGDALNFNAASNQYVSLASLPTSGTGSFSIFSWIKTSTTIPVWR